MNPPQLDARLLFELPFALVFPQGRWPALE
jgi:hypothetical protein